jgi:hypothetical protein
MITALAQTYTKWSQKMVTRVVIPGQGRPSPKKLVGSCLITNGGLVIKILGLKMENKTLTRGLGSTQTNMGPPLPCEYTPTILNYSFDVIIFLYF